MRRLVQKEALKQLGRLVNMHQDASEAGIIRTIWTGWWSYPGANPSRDSLVLSRLREDPQRGHFYWTRSKSASGVSGGAQAEKEDERADLCFVGPPAWARHRWASPSQGHEPQVVRMSLGGVRDEAETWGHRRTYIRRHAGTHHPGP
jgi:ATP-dependent Lon protease